MYIKYPEPKDKIGKAPDKSDTKFWNQWKQDVTKLLKERYKILDADLDRAILAELIKRGKNLPKSQPIKSLRKIRQTR